MRVIIMIHLIKILLLKTFDSATELRAVINGKASFYISYAISTVYQSVFFCAESSLKSPARI